MKLKTLFDLTGKNALVTGGSQGIGKAIALGLAESGANVIIQYNSNHKKAEQSLSELREYQVRSEMIAGNLSNGDVPQRIFNYCTHHLGKLDILILNASIQINNHWEEVDYNQFESQMKVNLWSNLKLIQLFSGEMRKANWGRIITIGSVQQKRPHPEMIVYSASKSAIENMVVSLAPDLARNKITINNLSPGAIATQRNKKALSDPGYARKVVEKIPIGRVGEAIDCAAMAVLLASEAGSYITGQSLYIDGGLGIPK